MNQRRHVTIVAAAATLLASAPLSTVFHGWAWSVDVLLAVAVICAAALGTRALRAPTWAQTLAMLGALLAVVTRLFGRGAFGGTIPTGVTLHHFADLLTSAGRDIIDLGVPVPDRDGLLFLTTVSVGLVAIVVDLVAVGLSRPALAGLPMLAMYWIPVLVQPDSVPVIPFVVGACGFLWLLVADNLDRVRRFGRRFTGDGRGVEAREPSPLAAAGRRLAAAGVVLAVLVPLALPRMTTGLLQRFGFDGAQGAIGFGPVRDGVRVDLFSALAGQLNQDPDRPVALVDVTTDDPSPFYSRLATADKLDRDGFSPRGASNGRPATGSLPDPTISASEVSQHRYTASVHILGLSTAQLPIYSQPTRISGLSGSWFYDPGSNVLHSDRETSTGKRYSMEFLHTEFTAAALRTAQPLPHGDEIQRLDTEVPADSIVDGKVAELTAGKTTIYDKVRALYDYFSASNGFTYHLSTASGTGSSDIDNFLENKQGYCEQYASALAWMVRAAHIPARVAVGFTRGGHHDVNTSTWTLTNLDLHAWTEVYFAGFGWVPFDATPAAGVPGSAPLPWAPDANNTGAISGPGGGVVTGPGGGASNPPVPGRDPDGPAGSGDQGGSGRALQPATWPFWALGSAILVVLLAIPAAQRASTRRRRRPAAAHARIAGPDAHAAWDELMDTLADYRLPLDGAETPRATAERIVTVLRLRPEAADGVRLLGLAEERARYARVPLPAAGLGAALSTARASIAGGAKRWTRIRAVLLPPSVLRRWRAGMVRRFGLMVPRTSRIRDAVPRPVRWSLRP